MIKREYYIALVQNALRVFPVCAILGPRQCGKTTLALSMQGQFANSCRFDLEDPSDLAKLDTPKLALDQLKGLVIIDEIQRRPELFPYLRVLVDKNPAIKLLILGSASHELIRQSSETLAGRIKYIELTPFTLEEVDDLAKLWERGGFPASYLATLDEDSYEWRKAYIKTFLEKDIAMLGFHISPQKMQQLWTMLAHYHGNVLNYTELGRSLGITDKTIKFYIDILAGALMVRVLSPWYENLKKRQIKSPKIYIRDSGLLHTLLSLKGQAIKSHPKLGASWEGFALEAVIFSLGVDYHDCYYWRTQTGAELDLLVSKGGKRIGYEFKYTDAPKLTHAMRVALKDLSLSELRVITPGDASFFIYEQVKVIGLEQLQKHMRS